MLVADFEYLVWQLEHRGLIDISPRGSSSRTNRNIVSWVRTDKITRDEKHEQENVVEITHSSQKLEASVIYSPLTLSVFLLKIHEIAYVNKNHLGIQILSAEYLFTKSTKGENCQSMGRV